MSSAPISIILVDDHRLMREGLRSLLERNADMRVVGEASDGRCGVKLSSDLRPDVVVMDVSMPGLNGIEAARQLCSRPSPPRIIALSMHADRTFIDEMLRAGASAYLYKDSALDDLSTAIRAVVAGRVFISPQIAAASGNGHATGHASGQDGEHRPDGAPRPDGAARAGTVFKSLSPREREVLQLMAEGKATKEIAMILTVSVKTVETHRRQLMEKLKLYSVAELTKYAIREGVTALE